MDSLNEPGLIGERYRIVEPLGSGNMGDVYRAVHAVTGQKIALKLLKPHVSQAQGGVKRFLREVQAAATIDHPGVVAVYDAGAHGETLYIAMELLEGEDLRDRLKSGAAPIDLLPILREMLVPLALAHDAGIVHRDLKPDNVFVATTPDGEMVKLLDFGIAADQTNVGATQTGLTVGTPHYMSPEQAIDPRQCGPQTDVWAFGVMLYEVLTGEVPFGGLTAHGVILKAISEQHAPLPDAVDAALRAVVDQCLAKEPADRPADARALGKLLDAAMPELAVYGASGALPAQAVANPTPKWPMLAAGVLVAAALGTWALLSGDAPPAEPDAAPIATAPVTAPPSAPPSTPPSAPETAPPSVAASPDAAVPDAAVPDAAVKVAATPKPRPRPRVIRRRPPATPKTAAPATEPPRPKAPATTAAPATEPPKAPVTAAPATVPARPVQVAPATKPPPRPGKPVATFGALQVVGAASNKPVVAAMKPVKARIKACVEQGPERTEPSQATLRFFIDADGFGNGAKGSGDAAVVKCAKTAARRLRLRRRPDTGEIEVRLPVKVGVKR